MKSKIAIALFTTLLTGQLFAVDVTLIICGQEGAQNQLAAIAKLNDEFINTANYASYFHVITNKNGDIHCDKTIPSGQITFVEDSTPLIYACQTITCVNAHY